ncbi:MAG TPA: hypothetical protein VE974_29085 [Thermoanaerobaculia bacterium]|nr:hypothetical protein [Thermoanaerobaculia bacterium]
MREMDETDYEDELLSFEEESGDFEGEFDSRESTGTARDDREIELAAELLSISDERELDEFFGRMVRRGRGRRRSPAGRKLKNLLRNGTRRVLPFARPAVGGFLVDDSATADADQDTPDDGATPNFDPQQMFGIETEGLSPEDRDLEIARRVVRLAGEAAQRLSDAPSTDATQAARRALIDAAQRHAPGLASYMRGGDGKSSITSSSRSNDSAGHWIRRQGTIVLLGARTSTSNRKKGEGPMHDLDRTLRSQESEGESYDFETDVFGEAESDYEDPSYEMSEEDELDLAAELLAVSDEGELDEFFRNLLKRAKGAVGSAVKTYLKPMAKRLIPSAARALGGFIGGPAGAAIGGKLGSYASTLFEVDFESMESEAQDLEVARRFVRFASEAANNAAASGATGNPTAVARAAVVNAAKTHAPGLIRPRGPRVNDRRGNGGTVSSPAAGNSGRWIRRDGRIVLLGV